MSDIKITNSHINHLDSLNKPIYIDRKIVHGRSVVSISTVMTPLLTKYGLDKESHYAFVRDMMSLLQKNIVLNDVSLPGWGVIRLSMNKIAHKSDKRILIPFIDQHNCRAAKNFSYLRNMRTLYNNLITTGGLTPYGIGSISRENAYLGVDVTDWNDGGDFNNPL